MAEQSSQHPACTAVHAGVPPFVTTGTLTYRTDTELGLELAPGAAVTPGMQLVIETSDPTDPRFVVRVDAVENGVLRLRVLRSARRERRAAPRYPSQLAIDLRCGDGREDHVGAPVEIALGGLAFDTDMALQVGEIVEVSFQPPWAPAPIFCKVRVVRTERNDPADHRVAVALLPNQPTAQIALGRLSEAIQYELLSPRLSVVHGPRPMRASRRA